jgi:beta-lactamase regulating signal transducer with metallopeptidase domain
MAANGSREQLFAQVSSTCMGLICRIALSYEADPPLRHELVQDILLAIWIALTVVLLVALSFVRSRRKLQNELSRLESFQLEYEEERRRDVGAG